MDKTTAYLKQLTAPIHKPSEKLFFTTATIHLGSTVLYRQLNQIKQGMRSFVQASAERQAHLQFTTSPHANPKL